MSKFIESNLNAKDYILFQESGLSEDWYQENTFSLQLARPTSMAINSKNPYNASVVTFDHSFDDYTIEVFVLRGGRKLYSKTSSYYELEGVLEEVLRVLELPRKDLSYTPIVNFLDYLKQNNFKM